MPQSGAGSGKRPKLPRVSENMRHLAAQLEQELLRWPDVSVHPMFGLRACYRGTVVFAMLPDKRALESPTSIGYKLQSGAPKKEGEKWLTFELQSEQDTAKALAYLDKAYSEAKFVRNK